MRHPIAVLHALGKLGRDIRAARLRRRIPVLLLAERAKVSRTTVGKVEKGDPGVSIGVYADVMYCLGLGTPFRDMADLVNDSTGLSLVDEALPKRIRARRRQDPVGD